MGKGQDLYIKAKRIIPGGTQLLSKRPEMFLPDLWPAYYSKAKGCKIWDLDGKEYIDMSYMGIGACILGYADNDIDSAVRNAIAKGNLTTLNAPEETELAELLCKLHPWAEMVRYARTGGEAMAIAVRIARAYKGKDRILFCGYHGWHDWYLAANLADEKALDGHLLNGLEPLGVPRVLKHLSIPFYYNDTEGLLKLIEQYKNDVGVIVLESIRNIQPKEFFINTINGIKKDLDIVLIVDEVSAGWRLNIGGAHLLLNLEPDIAVFAKGISNGYPMAAIIGKRDTMDIAQKTFISSLYWTDRIGPSAAIANINKMKALNVPNYLKKIGKKVKDGWKFAAKKNDINISVSGIDPLGHFTFNYKNHFELKTLFTQLMLEKGFLATNAFYASFSHKIEYIEKYLLEVDKSFRVIRDAIEKNMVNELLKGTRCHKGFQRLT